MKIELNEIPIKELVENYVDAGENGVTGFNDKLNIRPAYQREFVYKDKQRDAVIETIRKNFPLNVKWKPTTSIRGIRAVKLLLIIAKCFVSRITGENQGNKYYIFMLKWLCICLLRQQRIRHCYWLIIIVFQDNNILYVQLMWGPFNFSLFICERYGF